MINPSLSNSRKLKAFTLVELLVTIAIIGILVAILGGAGVKWMAWQRDPTNPNSNVSLTMNNIKQAVKRITQDIQQKSKTDYQALSPTDKIYYQTLANDLFNRNSITNPATLPDVVIGENDPMARSIQVFANMQIARNFPTLVRTISSNFNPVCDFDFNIDSVPYQSTSKLKGLVLTANSKNYNNFYAGMAPSSITQQLLTANTIKKNAPVAASTPNRDSSACLLVALESHPKGLKVEDLGSGVISIDSSNARIIQAGSTVIYHKIHYVDAADNAADKSFKVGSLRVDITYDSE